MNNNQPQRGQPVPPAPRRNGRIPGQINNLGVPGVANPAAPNVVPPGQYVPPNQYAQQPVNNAVGQNLPQGRASMNPEQLQREQNQDLDNRQIQMLAQLILSQNAAKMPQNDNIRQREGFTPVSNTQQKQKQMNQAQQAIDGGQARAQINMIRNGIALESTNENELIDIVENMTYQERQAYLNKFSLKSKSIYDPLPDQPDVYKINLIIARMLEERMYTF